MEQSMDRPTSGIGAVDWAMSALTVVAVGLLGCVTFLPVSAQTGQRVFVADAIACAIFALEFLWRWRRDGWHRRFLSRHWYEVIGMLPVSHPALHAQQLLRAVVLVVRVERAIERVFGARIVATLIGKVVETIKRPITVAVLDEVVDVLQTGSYSRNVARALEENRGELRAMILEKIKQDRAAGRLSVLPFHDDVVRLVADTMLRVVHEMLNDPRTDELVADMLRENVEQIRLAVRGRYAPMQPGDWPLPPRQGLAPPVPGARPGTRL
jgi:voltage-gated potassium channel